MNTEYNIWKSLCGKKDIFGVISSYFIFFILFFYKIICAMAEFPALGVMTTFMSDLHKDATKALASEHHIVSRGNEYRFVRLFNENEAKVISDSCDGVDGDGSQEKFNQNFKWGRVGSLDKAYEHYMTDIKENKIYFLLESEKRIRNGFHSSCAGMNCYWKSKGTEFAVIALLSSLKLFGQTLHTYQDRFSHTTNDGYPMSDFDHGVFTSSDNDEGKKDIARARTREVLKLMSSIKNYGCLYGVASCDSCKYWVCTENPIAKNHACETPKRKTYFIMYNAVPGLRGDAVKGGRNILQNIQNQWEKFEDKIGI